MSAGCEISRRSCAPPPIAGGGNSRFTISDSLFSRFQGFSSSAFTLVELLAAVTISGFVLAGVLTTYLQLGRSGARLTQYAEMNTQIRRGLEQFGSDVRCASGITWNGTSDVTLTIPTLAGGTRQVTYAWTSATQAFFLVPGASSAATAGRIYLQRGIPALADGSPGVVFARYDNLGNAATTDAATKRLQVSLYLTRSARTAAGTSDTAVSASFMLRNKSLL